MQIFIILQLENFKTRRHQHAFYNEYSYNKSTKWCNESYDKNIHNTLHKYNMNKSKAQVACTSTFYVLNVTIQRLSIIDFYITQYVNNIQRISKPWNIFCSNNFYSFVHWNQIVLVCANINSIFNITINKWQLCHSKWFFVKRTT